MPILNFLTFLIIIVTALFVGNAIFTFDEGVIITLYSCAGLFIAYQIYIYIYFNDSKFKNIKHSIKEYTKNCNELNDHIRELKRTNLNISSYDYGDGHIYDTSNYNFKRHEWRNNTRNSKIHNCSASVCKNANDQPFKYLCKYFCININEETLSNLENALNNFSAAIQGKVLLENEHKRILISISEPIPPLILYLSKKRLMKELGFEPISLSEIYFPIYTFQYVSSGGNSSYKVNIKLDMNNLERFINYLGEIIKFRKSIVGQRALMTTHLREKIKRRDNYTCQCCGLSIIKENNLLLEIDHIIPLSKGGITSEDNLQTLCWKCNRSKGAKMPLTRTQVPA